MPQFDKTGPYGYGPLTGRSLGDCCARFGRSSGRRFYKRGEEADILKEELSELEKEMEAIQERIKDLDVQS